MKSRVGLWAFAIVSLSCGGGGGASNDTGVADASPADADASPADADVADASLEDTDIADDASITHTSCRSLFAARILELQMEAQASFEQDCDAPLVDAIGELNNRGGTYCHAGESPNECRTRLYETPPSIVSELNPGCRDGADLPDGCLLGKWLPRCADGTDDGCGEPQAICQDGTRPMVYMEPGRPAASNDWVIFMGGEGDPCSHAACWGFYRYAAEQDKPGHERAMSSIHPDHKTNGAVPGQGISYGDPSGPYANPFVGYNRIRFNRCSESASEALESVALFDGTLQRTGTSQVWHHGYPIYQALFQSLTRVRGRDLDGDGAPDMPSLANANTIVIAGSSDATLWLPHVIDSLRDQLRQIAGPDVDVRLVLDGYFDTMLDNEARYGSSPPAGFNMFDHPYSVTRSCALPDNGDGEANEGCSAFSYTEEQYPDGARTMRGKMVARGSHLDASCESFHGAGAAPCYDKLHVLFHHVSTPFMVVADQEDAIVFKVLPGHADDPGYEYTDIGAYRTRVLDQANDAHTFWATAAREDGPGTVGDAAMLLRKSRRNSQGIGAAIHTHLNDNDNFNLRMTHCDQTGTVITSATMPATIQAWIDAVLPAYLIAEDAATWGGVGDYFVTGPGCRAPE